MNQNKYRSKFKRNTFKYLTYDLDKLFIITEKEYIGRTPIPVSLTT